MEGLDREAWRQLADEILANASKVEEPVLSPEQLHEQALLAAYRKGYLDGVGYANGYSWRL